MDTFLLRHIEVAHSLLYYELLVTVLSTVGCLFRGLQILWISWILGLARIFKPGVH